MTQEELKRVLKYDGETGEFKRLDRKNGNGSIDAHGYLVIKIKSKQYKAHRLAWLYTYGAFPDGVIDHINRVKLDNRIENLRDVLPRDNARNATLRVNTSTGVRGVRVDTTNGLKKNFAVNVMGKTYRFYTLKEAVAFRTKKLKENGYGDGHF